MPSFIIIGLILAGLTVHRYLSMFWEQGTLPYSFGFLFFSHSFAIICLVNFIWMLGAVAGVAVFLLCYLQVVYSAGLWVFSLPWLIRMHREQSLPQVNPLVYGGFSFLVMAIAGLTVVNFFVSSYKSVWDAFGENVWTAVFGFAGVLIVGNVARVGIMSKMIKEWRATTWASWTRPTLSLTCDVSRTRKHVGTESKPDIGRRLVLAIIIAVLILEMLTILINKINQGPEPLRQQIIRFLLTIGLCVFLFRGANWARWVAGILSIGAVLLRLGSSYIGMTSLLLIAIELMVYLASGIVLFFVPAVRKYFGVGNPKAN